jgi:cyanocobalamin reductase (cyanide-eliminating) / alkylcobalamin dealkylase
VSLAEWQQIAMRLEATCAEVGLDLVHAFGVGKYNAVAPPGGQLTDFGAANALGILIGNTRKLWPPFTHAARRDETLKESTNPLDNYVTTQLTNIVRQATPHAHQLVFSHVTEPRAFPIQRLAELVGFAAVSPSHLAIHPLHGPWFALRAVVVVDVPGPETALPEPERPCRGCSAPCVPALERAVAASGTPLTSVAVAAHAADWLAVRDACPVGRSSRYGDAQLSYHYDPTRSRIRLD